MDLSPSAVPPVYHVSVLRVIGVNRHECWNNKMEKYPTLKTQKKSGAGVQRICDGMTFLANWDAFKTYIVEMEAKTEKLRTLIGADVGNMDLKPELRGAIAHLRWVRKWQAK